MTSDTYPALLQSGNDLVAQAQTVATQDFAAARALWREAGALFLRAHEADPLQHAAALRLAQASMAEAHARPNTPLYPAISFAFAKEMEKSFSGEVSVKDALANAEKGCLPLRGST